MAAITGTVALYLREVPEYLTRRDPLCIRFSSESLKRNIRSESNADKTLVANRTQTCAQSIWTALKPRSTEFMLHIARSTRWNSEIPDSERGKIFFRIRLPWKLRNTFLCTVELILFTGGEMWHRKCETLTNGIIGLSEQDGQLHVVRVV